MLLSHPVTLCSQSLKTSTHAGNLAPAVADSLPPASLAAVGALSDHVAAHRAATANTNKA